MTDADRLNEIRERYEHAKVLIVRDELRSVDMPSWSDVRDLLAALDAAEQERDEALAELEKANTACSEIWAKQRAAEAVATKATNALEQARVDIANVYQGGFDSTRRQAADVGIQAIDAVLADLATEEKP